MAFRSAYRSAGIKLCDSRIIAALARLKGISLPVIAGSDLTELLMKKHFDSHLKIAIVGGSQTTLIKVKAIFPRPQYVQYIPPMGVINQPAEMLRVADFVAAEKPILYSLPLARRKVKLSLNYAREIADLVE